MSNAFREILRKIGSGPHTGENMTRFEAAEATRMMLLQEATPAQIGAFMIAHRIKRPTGEELAGMLDACDQLGPKLQPIDSQRPVIVLGTPYDGRSRTAPVTPLTALILATAGQQVVMHGGGRMPTKEGLPLVEIWQGLGVDWSGLSLAQTQQVFETTKIGFIYLPSHFPLAASLVPYRDQIGKRPPFATMELMWCPYAGVAHVIAGFVHPPTEGMFQGASALRGKPQYFTTVKGLEGSCDLPRDRTPIIGTWQPGSDLERIILHPRDYGFEGKEVPLDEKALVPQMQLVLQGKPGEFTQAAIWNGGFYLWHSGVATDLSSGLAEAENLLKSGQVAQKLQEISKAVASLSVFEKYLSETGDLTSGG
ncbi:MULTISPECIES: anthranilate phosphoribosyltransferase family protein [Cyanophyceae]|uniref:anthranilate phosphoribosyltransferase family protein n=1 Tax=Cyanophyceae TaxID=3028117 RepID=UPI0016873838|nr:anthranilate phosphoribosyltransferase family protein [Trichocoleus sp. FACHB-69]MBD1931419.1 anthranilate phosphoribosyltransferase family protein [Trichocoleus sp. FACHB-69]